MRKPLLIVAFLASIASLLTSLSEYHTYTYIPVIISLLLGCYIYYKGRRHQYPKKPIQMIFMIAIIAISVAIFKTVYFDIPVEDGEQQELEIE